MAEKLTHWKKLNNPDYLGAYSLDPGKDLTLTIKLVEVKTVIGADNRKDDCMVITFRENVKPMIVNATNAKTITKLYKTPYIEQWAGRAITLFATDVKAFGDTVEALRIRPTIPKSTVVVTKCTDCNGDIKSHEKYTPEQIATSTYNKFGKALCFSCGEIAKSLIVEATNPFDTPQTAAEQTDTPQTEPTITVTLQPEQTKPCEPSCVKEETF